MKKIPLIFILFVALFYSKTSYSGCGFGISVSYLNHQYYHSGTPYSMVVEIPRGDTVWVSTYIASDCGCRKITWKCDGSLIKFPNPAGVPLTMEGHYEISVCITGGTYYRGIYLKYAPELCGSLTFPIFFVQALQDTIRESDDSDNIESSYYNIYPNPFTRTIELTIAVTEPTPVEYHIYNSSGRKIKSYTVKNLSGELKRSEDFDELQSGIYILRFIIGEENFTRKLIKL